MSVEPLVIAEIVEEGSPRKALQGGLTEEDFELYDEEWAWILRQYESRKPINRRTFKKKFEDFDFIRTGDRLQDLIEELRHERAYVGISASIDQVLQELDHENALEKAMWLRDVLGDIVKSQGQPQDVMLKGDWQDHLDEMKRIRAMRENGETVGIPTGIKNLDHHWGGAMPGRLITVLARPGNTKSFTIAKIAVSAMMDGRKVGLFSPEMNKFEHECRVHTLLSANKEIQKACGLTEAFRNRALMDGTGFNIKTYKRFLEYCDDEIKGEIALFTQTWRRTKMSPSYIESRIEDLGLEMVIVDPIYKLKSPRKRSLKHEELADVVDMVQDMSESFNIPIIMSNQANRQMTSAKDAPSQDASFGSDAPAHESDHIIGVKYFEDERKLILRCTKNRFGGGNFKVEINFHPNIGVYDDVTPIRGDYYNGHDDEKVEELKQFIEGDVKSGIYKPQGQ